MIWQQLINGLTIGSTYALVTIGFSLIFGILRLMNFANGAIFILGAYLTLMIYTRVTSNFIIALIGSILITGIVGYSVDRFGLRILREKSAPRLAPMILTMGMSTIIENFILNVFGSETKAVPYSPNMGYYDIGPVRIGGFQILILAVAIILMILVSLLVYRTKLGKAMLATSQNQTAAALMGINVAGVIGFTFFLSAVLSSISGTIVGMYYKNIDVTLSAAMGNKTFAAAVVGGIGNVPGAIIGGLVVGVIETLGASYLSTAYRDAIAFAILIVVLLVKPTGFFGKKDIVKV